MTAAELFRRLAPLVGPALEAGFKRRDLCVFATRIAIDVGQYFGVEVEPVATRVMLYNRAFAAHVDRGEIDVKAYSPVDGSWSVGIGYGYTPGQSKDGKWNGHLIAVAGGMFGDFSLWQAERPQYSIIVGPGVIGPYSGKEMWSAENSEGTRVEYQRVEDLGYRAGPDWRFADRRRRIVGAIIRELKK